MKTIRKKCLIILLGIFMLSSSLTFGQYTITPYPPPPEFVFDDLWHFTITRPAVTNNVEYYVALRVFNDQNTLLLKSNSSVFQLQQPVFYIDKTDLSAIDPFSTLYYENIYQAVVSSGDFFPAGNYNFVYTLLGRPNDGEFTELAEGTTTATVNLFMPPILTHPEDMDTIDTPFPLLTWLPAYQASIGQTIHYHLRLVEMFSGQTSALAISANPTYFEQAEIPVTVLNYPAGANPIELNHTYAWQVAATIGGVPVAYSQIWQFTYAIPQAVFPEIVDNKQYYTFFEKLDGSVVPVNENSIRMRIQENYYNYNGYLSFKIFGNKNELIASSDDLSIQMVNGLRFVEIPLCTDDIQLDQNKVYLVEVSNIKNQKRYLRVKIKFDKNNCQ